MSELQNKIAGCLIGQSLGDALGHPIEGRDESECNHFVFNAVKSWFEGDIPSKEEWTGQYTDDSQLARELAISLVENNGWHPEDYAARIASIFRDNSIVGRGIACDIAASRLIAGSDWKSSGEPAPSAGNGTAMRAAPIGLYFRDDVEKMKKAAHEQGWITHHDTRCSAGSVAIAGASKLALEAKELDKESLVRTLSEWMESYDAPFATMVLQLVDWIDLPPHEAMTVIGPAGKAEGYSDGWPGISPFVVPTVLWSLYCFLRYPDSYWDAISTALSVGGDVDTTAAITGAISGAYLGLDGLPAHLVTRVNDYGAWGFDDLLDIARKLCDCGAVEQRGIDT